MPRIKLLALVCAAAIVYAPATSARCETSDAPETSDLESPATVRDAFRLDVSTFVAPSASFNGDDVTLVRPHMRLRARAPLGERITAQLSAGFSTSHYDVDGRTTFFRDCIACSFPEDLYAVSLGLELGILLNRTRHLFKAGEQWGLLLAGFGRARWESGAFDESMTGQGILGLGYELPDRLRIGLGARVANSLENGGVSVDPFVEFRWDINERLRLRTRNLGLQLELRPNDAFELYLTGFRQSERFRLDSREGAPSDLSFRDRQILVGVGAERKVWRWLRIAGEAGAIVDRSLEVSGEDDGKLDTVSGDPSAYFELRLELRP